MRRRDADVVGEGPLPTTRHRGSATTRIRRSSHGCPGSTRATGRCSRRSRSGAPTGAAIARRWLPSRDALSMTSTSTADVTTMRIERPETSLQIVARVVVDDDHREVGLDHPYLLTCRAYRCRAGSAEGLPRTWRRTTSDSSRATGQRGCGDPSRRDPPLPDVRLVLHVHGSDLALIEAQYMVDWDEYYTDDRSPERKADRCLAQIAHLSRSGRGSWTSEAGTEHSRWSLPARYDSWLQELHHGPSERSWRRE